MNVRRRVSGINYFLNRRSRLSVENNERERLVTRVTSSRVRMWVDIQEKRCCVWATVGCSEPGSRDVIGAEPVGPSAPAARRLSQSCARVDRSCGEGVVLRVRPRRRECQVPWNRGTYDSALREMKEISSWTCDVSFLVRQTFCSYFRCVYGAMPTPVNLLRSNATIV